MTPGLRLRPETDKISTVPYGENSQERTNKFNPDYRSSTQITDLRLSSGSVHGEGRGHAGPYLKVVLWVPVGVKDDDGIRGGKIDSDPAGLGADEE